MKETEWKMINLIQANSIQKITLILKINLFSCKFAKKIKLNKCKKSRKKPIYFMKVLEQHFQVRFK